ncbi:platelet glycoprotein V-like, partial [Temnothorax curvispinosus]|uniref:Platelet glycoprotein V-like n=1 Tax=Temnothorax curvispinosus TaxID=300111 RepID=A0A6J1QUH2_9HYME
MFIYKCDLPTNNSLGEITQTLGITGVKKLVFQSNKNLSFALVKHHLDDFENLKSLSLTNNNVSYADKDLLAGLVNLTDLNLRDNNLHQVTGFFNYTPGLQFLELEDNALQSIEPGTFDNLKNLTFLNLSVNHLTDPRSGIFDELVALRELDLNTNDMVRLPEYIFAKLKNLDVLNLSENNFTNLPRNLLQNNTKLRNFTLFDNKRNMTTLPDAFFANLTKLEMLKLKRNGFVTLPEDLFWGCTSLININLEQNYLRTLPRYIFRDL